MSELLKIILYILFSSVKFAAGPPFAYYSDSYNFSYFELIIYSIIGGMFGVVVFTFFSRKLIDIWEIIRLRFKKATRKNNVFSTPKLDHEFDGTIKYSIAGEEEDPKRKVFSKQSRRIVALWKKYGYFGIAFLTPIILSIPLGTFIATRYFKKKRYIFLYMFISIVFWSIVLSTVFYLFDVQSVKELEIEVLE